MKETIVLHPVPGFHHMVSLVELGKLILQHHPHFSITILVPTMPLDTSTTTSSYINHISKTNLPITFFFLPSIPHHQETQDQAAMILECMRLNASFVVDALQTMCLSSSILALITSSVYIYDGLDNLHIPTYYYFTSCASTLAILLHLPTLHNQTTKSFKDLNDTLLHVPGIPPIKASYMPQLLLDRDGPAYHYFFNYASCMSKSKGVVVNTFDILEPQAVNAIASGACISNGATLPIYSIGPLITDAKDQSGNSTSEALAWLDAQPSRSIVFLCFGSKGTFSEAQHEKIAHGLERSNQRFLWVVKSPKGSTSDQPQLEILLPEGFLERTKGRGLVVKCWAPQNAILRHESVGGFVTHCGWNSLLEAVSYGVPIVSWPLYAEQHLNAVVLVEEMKLAIPIDTSTSMVSCKEGEEEGLVSAEEVEKKVRQLMEFEEGNVLRQRSLEMRAMAMAAWTSGGSSFTAFTTLVASWKQG
ncbi:anthocyanidin 5,3-O-glucosyltransferase [Quercus suber]|uniref:Glycosyltransferase n=1 Tax=Quercus suber TaxID=58331 RepID=A0AAW0KB35_QUESU